MHYVQTDSPIADAAAAVAARIDEHLGRGERVVWLLSGGSGGDIAVAASNLLRARDLTNLSITLSDERYGPVGHADENWQQLLNAGFSAPGAHLYRPLIGESRGATTTAFAAWLEEQLEQADYAIGIFGMGTDGHTSGIKPHSPAVTATSLAVDYDGEDYERITTTPHALRLLDEAIVQVSGEEKAGALHQLVHETLPEDIQPAQLLKATPRLTIYTTIPKEEHS